MRTVKGFPVREWVKASSDRNEALDCLVYAYATLQWVARRYNRATMWDQLEASLAAAAIAPGQPSTPPIVKRRSGGWM
jgi:phage terminase large subunit GpA-like protein